MELSNISQIVPLKFQESVRKTAPWQLQFFVPAPTQREMVLRLASRPTMHSLSYPPIGWYRLEERATICAQFAKQCLAVPLAEAHPMGPAKVRSNCFMLRLSTAVLEPTTLA